MPIIPAMSTPEDFDRILVMGSIHRVLKAEKVLKARSIRVETLVTPREVSADCGMVVLLAAGVLEEALALLEGEGVSPVEVWRWEANRFVLDRSTRAAKGREEP